MKKAVIIAGVILLILVLAFAGLAVFAKSYLTDERIRQLVVPRIEKAIKRDVSIGTLKVSIFSGISLENLTISDREGKGTFIKGDKLVLRYKLLPLLKKQILIDSLELVSPRVNITRNRDGQFNYEDIVAGKKGEKKEEKPSGGGLALLVNNISIRDAVLTLRDESGELPEVNAVASAEIGLSTGPSGRISPRGTVDIRKINLTWQGISPDLSGKVKFTEKDLNLDIRARLIDTALSVKGKVADYMTKPSITIDLDADRIDAGSLIASLGKAAGKGKKGPSSRGRGASKTSTTLPEISGRVLLGKILYNNMEVGPLNLSYKAGESDLSLSGDITTEGGSVNLKADLKKLFTSPSLTFEIRSDDLNLDPILASLPEKKKEDEPSKKPEKTPKKKLKPLPVPANITIKGTLKAAKLQVNRVVISELIAETDLTRGVFRLKTFKGKISGGEFAVSSRADLTDPALPYSKKIKVKDVAIHKLLLAFQPKVAGMVFGSGNLSLDLNGKGRTPDLIKKSLGGEGSFLLRDGKFTGTELTRKLALFLGLPELETIPFDVSEGTLKMKKGVIRLESSIKSPDLSMNPHGKIDLPSDRLDIRMELAFSERLTQKLKENTKFAQYLVGESKQGSLPLKVSGSLSSPSYGLDMEALAGRAKKKVEKHLTEELMKKLPGKGSDKNGDKKKRPPIGNMLKGIFGK